MTLRDAKRIAIIGCCGAGKSTLATWLGEILGIQVYHLDALHWQPGWVETPEPEWSKKVEDLVQGESWIIDGNYGNTIDIRAAAADAIIFLDFPRVLCLWRVTKRWLRHRGKTRPDMGPGCPERMPDLEFARWIWGFHKRSRPKVLAAIENNPGATIITLRGPGEVRRFLSEMRSHVGNG